MNLYLKPCAKQKAEQIKRVWFDELETKETQTVNL